MKVDQSVDGEPSGGEASRIAREEGARSRVDRTKHSTRPQEQLTTTILRQGSSPEFAMGRIGRRVKKPRQPAGASQHAP